VIVKYNGESVDDAGQLSSRVSMAAPGERAALEVLRDGKLLTLTATIGSASDATVASNNAQNGAAEGRLGLSVRPLTPEERAQAGVSSGLVVEDVAGRAARAGIQPGDVVLSVNGTDVHSANELRELVRGHDKQIALLVQRGDARIFVPVSLG
jgi:serine protease Do